MRRHVLCYDVADDRRRRQVARVLEDVGVRIQDSVFEADLDHDLLDRLRERVRRCLAPAEDSFTIYPLCAACARRRESLGVDHAAAQAWGEVVIVV